MFCQITHFKAHTRSLLNLLLNVQLVISAACACRHKHPPPNLLWLLCSQAHQHQLCICTHPWEDWRNSHTKLTTWYQHSSEMNWAFTTDCCCFQVRCTPDMVVSEVKTYVINLRQSMINHMRYSMILTALHYSQNCRQKAVTPEAWQHARVAERHTLVISFHFNQSGSLH